jgi:hypothetical protein
MGRALLFCRLGFQGRRVALVALLWMRLVVG